MNIKSFLYSKKNLYYFFKAESYHQSCASPWCPRPALLAQNRWLHSARSTTRNIHSAQPLYGLTPRPTGNLVQWNLLTCKSKISYVSKATIVPWSASCSTSERYKEQPKKTQKGTTMYYNDGFWVIAVGLLGAVKFGFYISIWYEYKYISVSINTNIGTVHRHAYAIFSIYLY